MKGLKVGINSQQKIILKGQLMRINDWHIISKKFPSHLNFKFKAQIPDHLKKDVQSHFQKLLSTQSLPTLNLQFHPSLYFSLPSSLKSLKTNYQLVLHPYGLPIKNTPHLIANTPMVRVQITVAEVKRSEIQKLGIKWNSVFETNLVTSNPIFQSLATSLQALEKTGQSRILASPTILCQSGKSADFLAGGEIPIPIIKDDKQSVVWKKYGVQLKISPKADFRGRMSIKIETEVSSLDMSHATHGLPSLHTNRIKSHFNLEKSRTIALSGLIQKQQGKSIEGLPLLKKIPILGHLFSSHDFLTDQTELIIFVTPEVVNSSKDTTSLYPRIEHIEDVDDLIKKFLYPN